MAASSNLVPLFVLILLSRSSLNLAADSGNQNGETEEMLTSLKENYNRNESQSASTTTIKTTTGAEDATASTNPPTTSQELDTTLIPSVSASDELMIKVGKQFPYP